MAYRVLIHVAIEVLFGRDLPTLTTMAELLYTSHDELCEPPT